MKRGTKPFVLFSVAALLVAVIVVAGMIAYDPGTWADPASWKALGRTAADSLRAAQEGAESFASGVWASSSGKSIPERLQSHIGK